MTPDASTPFLEVDDACAGARDAFELLHREPARGAFLEAIALALAARKEEIIAQAAAETALTPDELDPEFTRMVRTLEMFGALVADGSWVRAAIDTRLPDSDPRLIGPNHDLRSMRIPLGPVAVFGASNFPLAYGVCGGDTASALAAGCPVVVKEHPAHPQTGRLIASIASKALAEANAPPWTLNYVLNKSLSHPNNNQVAEALVRDECIQAVGFTGSFQGSKAIQRLARKRKRPIPVFAEMGSNNIVLVTRSALAERGRRIADELAKSILVRVGQQCTNTGVVIIDNGSTKLEGGGRDPLTERLLELLPAAEARRMLAPNIHQTYQTRLDDIPDFSEFEASLHQHKPATDEDQMGRPAVLEVDSYQYNCDDPRYRDEIFGPACMVTVTDLTHPTRFEEMIFGMNLDSAWGQLVACVYTGPEVSDSERRAIDLLRRVCGRLVFNGVPTGVRVATSTVHGGPYPSSNRPDTTAVGPRAIERWCRPACWQNAPRALLPQELHDENPLGIWRTVNGVLTKEPVRS